MFTSYDEMRIYLDKQFFAYCLWYEDDLNEVRGIEKLPSELRREFMRYIADTLAAAMVETGWDVLSDGLTCFLSEKGLGKTEVVQ